MTFHLSYANVLYDGDWGTVERPIIRELLSYSDKYVGGFYYLRRAIRISIVGVDTGEADLEFFLELGVETFSFELLSPTISDAKLLLAQIQSINRTYKQEDDFASVELANVKIEYRKGMYYCTGIVRATKASED